MKKQIEFRSFLALTLAALTALTAPTFASAQARPHGRDEAAAAPATASSEGVVNIQTASPDELQRLPGIGPSKAQAIITFRERTAFRRVEDILRVRGIGRATFRRLRPYLTVSGPTTLTTDVGGRRPTVATDAEADDEADSPH